VLAYTNEIRRQLIDTQTLSETTLGDLAMQRAKNTKFAILEYDENLQNRDNILETTRVTKEPDELIKMKVTLSTN